MKIHSLDLHNRGKHKKMLMTREQVIIQAARQFTFRDPVELIFKLDEFEHTTTELLHHSFPPEHKLDSPARDMKYVRTSCHLTSVLTQQHLLYLNLIAVSDVAPLTKPLAVTFLAALAEGYYVYHVHSEKRLFSTVVQLAASKRWMTAQRHQSTKKHESAPQPRQNPSQAPQAIKQIEVRKEAVQNPPQAPQAPALPTPAPEIKQVPDETVRKQKRTTPPAPETFRRSQLVGKVRAKKSSRDTEAIKAIQRAKAAEALQRSREAEAAEKAKIKAAAVQAVQIIEAEAEAKKKKAIESEVEVELEPHHHVMEYMDDEPHVWCTMADCACHWVQ